MVARRLLRRGKVNPYWVRVAIEPTEKTREPQGDRTTESDLGEAPNGGRTGAFSILFGTGRAPSARLPACQSGGTPKPDAVTIPGPGVAKES
jgi:hypothetical protein